MSKRASGEGNVRQRGDGRWEARLSYVDPVTGRRRSTSFYGPTAEAVRDKLDEARDCIKVEAPVRDSTLRLSRVDRALVGSRRWRHHRGSRPPSSCTVLLARKASAPAAVGRHPVGQAAEVRTLTDRR